jgi:hypothetical protein
MRPLYCLIALSFLAVLLLSVSALSAGTGIKVFAPSVSSVRADSLPFSYNGSFIVMNDGWLEGVYVVRIAVDDPAVITWVNVTPSGFTLAPGETRIVAFSLDVSADQAVAGTYHFIFMPARLPAEVEPYTDTFFNYVSEVDSYNFTVEIPADIATMPSSFTGQRLVVFTGEKDRVNLVQYSQPTGSGRSVVMIDRAVKIDMPSGVPVGQPVNISLSVFESLSSRGIELMAISPEGVFYPVTGDNFTFDRIGRWGVIALLGDEILLGKPVDVTQGGVQLVMPGIGTILAAISLLLLLAVVPIWLAGRGTVKADPYEDIAFKAYVIRKYIGQFDRPRLLRAVSQLREEYDSLVARHVRGNREKAQVALQELETLARLELLPGGQDTGEPGEGAGEPLS